MIFLGVAPFIGAALMLAPLLIAVNISMPEKVSAYEAASTPSTTRA